MASIIKRNGSYMFMVSCGYDIHGKQVRRTMTYTPDSVMPIPPRQRGSTPTPRRRGLRSLGAVRFARSRIAPSLLLSPTRRGASGTPQSADAATAEQLDRVLTQKRKAAAG